MTSLPANPAPLTKADYELLAAFRYRLRKFLRFSEVAATQHGVTPQQYQALLAIEGFPGRNWVTMGELAEQMQIAHHSAVGLVDRMEALHLVSRAPSTSDRRRVRLSLTRQGLSILRKLYRIHRTELGSVGGPLAALLLEAASQSSETEADSASAPPAARYASPACSMPEIVD